MNTRPPVRSVSGGAGPEATTLQGATSPAAVATAPPAVPPAKPGSFSVRPGSKPAPGRTPGPKPGLRPTAKPGAKPQEEAPDVPHLKEMREFMRHLQICEKNLGLYPVHSKIVKEGLDKFFSFAKTLLEETATIRLEITQDRILFDGAPIYEEPEKSRSLAFRLHKDGVREVTFDPKLGSTELADFLVCLREARKVDEEDDDFVTMFWEKDAPSIDLRLADDFLTNDDLPKVPDPGSRIDQLRIERFRISPAEKDQLREALEARKDGDQGDSTFEISPEESQRIREMVLSEASYIPLFDFADILLEVMAHNPQPDAFSRSVKMIRAIIAAVVEDLDFDRAAFLMEKFSRNAHPGLNESHRRQLREMLETFTDKQTLLVLDTYLKDHDKLPPNHPVFKLLKAFPPSAAASFCPFLKHEKHVPALSTVLVHLASGQVDAYAAYLDDPDPIVVRAMVGVILAADKDKPLHRIAKALRHPDESVRVVCARAILQQGDATMGSMFLPLLEESSKPLLNLALEFFGKFACPEAYDRLQTLVNGSGFLLLDPKRKRLCFSALLKCSFAKGMEFLSGKVLRWPFCFGAASRDKKAAALEALALTKADAAQAILERWAARKRSSLRPVAERALRDMAALKAVAASEPRSAPQKTEAPNV